MPIHCGDIPSMSACFLFGFECEEVPYFEEAVSRSTGQFAVGRRETHVVDRLVVASLVHQVLHVHGPVFDVSARVRRH